MNSNEDKNPQGGSHDNRVILEPARIRGEKSRTRRHIPGRRSQMRCLLPPSESFGPRVGLAFEGANSQVTSRFLSREDQPAHRILSCPRTHPSLLLADGCRREPTKISKLTCSGQTSIRGCGRMCAPRANNSQASGALRRPQTVMLRPW